MVDRTKYKITVQNERFRIETIRKAEKAKREAENDRKKRSKLNAKLGEVFEQVKRDFPLMDINNDQHFRATLLAPIGGWGVFVRMQILEAVSKVMVC